MKSNNYEDDDSPHNEVDDMFDEEISDNESFIQMVNAGNETKVINQELLKSANDIASKSIFWRFKSVESKIKIITHIYNELTELVK